MSFSKDLHKDGYFLLQNILSNDELVVGLSSIQKDKVDYSKIKNYIDTIFLKKIKESTTLTDPKYVKFRFSNNNNSTDASTFHGDIYNHSDIELLPIYTCLCYFDEAQLEIIPGSHKKTGEWSIQSYNKKKILKIIPGDILIFHSNIHHRGIQFNEGNRRLLQVFEVFPDKKTYDEHFPKLVIVQSSKSVFMKNIINPLLYEISKYPIIDFITFLHYILIYNDLQYKIGMMDLPPWEKDNKYISYEPGKRILMEDLIKTNYIDDFNINILCDKNVISVPYSYYYFYFYIIYWIISLLFIYMITKFCYSKKKYFLFGVLFNILFIINSIL